MQGGRGIDVPRGSLTCTPCDEQATYELASICERGEGILIGWTRLQARAKYNRFSSLYQPVLTMRSILLRAVLCSTRSGNDLVNAPRGPGEKSSCFCRAI
jgi:hypothetical protein